ncbi:MAG: hypothetical protein IT480_09155 [Gammaproteobacteria bacterium]|nr:hypothetical protein [Gammaproteobacteria bacterium]
MGGNSDSDDYEDDGDEEIGADTDIDLDRVIRDLDIAKRRAPRAGEPAWRRLEQRLEQKHTAELISDFEDYDIGDGSGEARTSGGTGRKTRRQH